MSDIAIGTLTARKNRTFIQGANRDCMYGILEKDTCQMINKQWMDEQMDEWMKRRVGGWVAGWLGGWVRG